MSATDNRQVYRLSTSCFQDRRGAVHINRTLRIMRRLSTREGATWLEDVSMTGADDAVDLIENLGDCCDGLYKLVFIPGHRDWETGNLESWTYKLWPFDPTAEERQS